MDKKDKSLNAEQISATIGMLDYVKENHQVLDPVTWKRGAVKYNYIIAGIPALWALLGSFGINVGLTSDQAVSILQSLLVIVPILHNILLAITSRNVTLSIKAKTKMRSRDINDSDE